MKMSTESLIKELNEKFPRVWAKPGKAFSESCNALVWSGEGSEINGLDAFDMYCCSETLYIHGVHKDLSDWAEAKGLYWEAYDSGTFFLYRI